MSSRLGNSHNGTNLRLSANSGPLAQVWLASNLSNLSKTSVLQTSVVESAHEIARAACFDDVDLGISSEERITLRVSGELLQGIVRVYSKQAAFLLTDIKDTLTKINSLFKANQRLNIKFNRASTIARVEQLLLEDAVTEKEVLSMPGLNFLSDNLLPREFNIQEGSMDRKVQGAMQWADTSIELGRRLEMDDELEHNNSTTLDLNFDLENDSESHAEGTRQSTLQAASFNITNTDLTSNLIQEDEFPLEDLGQDDWDLGITEENDKSIEVGRRAESSIVEEPSGFDFNLGLEKEPEEEQLDVINSSLRPETATKERTQKQTGKNSRRLAGLANVQLVQIDDEPELDDKKVKAHSRYVRQNGEKPNGHERIPSTKLTQKRLFKEYNEAMSFIPQNILDELLGLPALKRIKCVNEDVSGPQMDISINFDDALDQDSDFGGNASPQHSDHNITLNDQANLDDSVEDGTRDRQDSTTEEVVGKDSEGLIELAHTIRSLTPDIDGDNNVVTFKEILNKKVKDVPVHKITKQQASSAFFDILSLATNGCVKLSQNEVHGPIEVAPQASIYTDFIVA